MSKRNAVEPVGGGGAARGASADRAFWLVPRRWLLGLAALVILPWFITAAAFYSRAAGEVATDSSSEPSAVDAPSALTNHPRPWGQLVVTPIVISPPLEYVSANWGPIEKPEWRFPQTSPEELESFLTWTGLGPEQVRSLVAAARREPRIGGLIVTPDVALVRGLAPEIRARLYLQLAKSPLNPRQLEAYRYRGGSPGEWLGQSPISARTRELIDPLIYSVDGFLYFADIDLVRQDIESPEELQFLAKRLLRSSTMLVELRIGNAAEVEAAAEYWGRGGRRTDIRPLLESVAASGGGRTIDVSHLLPIMVREHLYRYPQISLRDVERQALVNCFWTALNFFNPSPDDRFLDAAFAIDRLKRDYYIVHDNLQLGDIAVFSSVDGSYFHAAVYLADGLVFGKNGTSSLSPWTIVPIEQLKGYYVEYTDGWTVTYYRRKDL